MDHSVTVGAYGYEVSPRVYMLFLLAGMYGLDVMNFDEIYTSFTIGFLEVESTGIAG